MPNYDSNPEEEDENDDLEESEENDGCKFAPFHSCVYPPTDYCQGARASTTITRESN